MSFLQAKDIKKSYHIGKKDLDILQGISFEIDKGTSLAITGASGVGKSTLLNILGLLDKPDEGFVAIDGVNITQMPKSRQTKFRAAEIGFVFQSFQLFQEMNVLENVLLPTFAMPTSKSGRENRERAERLLRSVEMGHRLDHKPVELSGGEQQRVALARALMNSPAMILADEPTGNIDEETGNHILDMLFNLVKELEITFICVTHDKSLAARCDRQINLQ
ncbi:MAG: ABC transporter ATP-binding protein [Kiritimatiellae bacterium]|jgi:putative ABC transport system ATP-binding protein|nr:ABC transporter ATP-binding protein [Kiritimatiellia bacterium]